ncbi:amidase family protein [Diplodia corticola]|uniref:Amidase family protein n=1 Tax=Diplodia corticola TaxID=236234 RepID=A0A1J9RU35_9PEZI|nr:amidase family protein [Diplodia corticola]OJD36083.1 amidase family protein [Diplodia corticola]
MDAPFPFDTLTTTATHLSTLLRAQTLTSVELVDVYLAQIDRHNRKGRQLRAIISVAPRYHLFALARRLDDERRAGHTRGPLHGIPVVVQDNMATDVFLQQLDTTAGSYAFVGARPRRAATAVDRLVAAGLIVLGKSNLSELGGLKSPDMAPGWSAVGGQTSSPFVARRLEKGVLIWDHTAPGGSGAGSAVAVAAGFAPLAVATDTVGSVLAPANRAGLYALKTSVGEVPVDGVLALSRSFDAVAAAAKSAADVTFLVDAVMQPLPRELEAGMPLRYRMFQVRGRWNGLRVGFVDPAIWRVGKDFSRLNADAEKYMMSMYEMAISRIRDHGAVVSYPVQAPSPQVFRNNGPMSSFEIVAYKEFKSILADWFANLDDSRVRSLAGLIEFNAAHPDIELPKPFCPDQHDLLTVLGESSPDALVRDHLAALRRLGGPEGIDLVLDHYGVDVLAAPGDSALCELAAAAGYPIAVVPLGALRSNGRPFGVAVTARRHAEPKLLHFMTAWENVFHPPPPPPSSSSPSTSSHSSSSHSSHSSHHHHPFHQNQNNHHHHHSARPTPLPLSSVRPYPPTDEPLPPDAPIVAVILKEWDARDFRRSSDALAAWLNARWRKSGYSLGAETVYEILKTNGRKAYRGLGDEAGGAFRRRGRFRGDGDGGDGDHGGGGGGAGGAGEGDRGEMGDWGVRGEWDERREDSSGGEDGGGGEVKPLFGGPS